jgi:hypothetical protein
MAITRTGPPASAGAPQGRLRHGRELCLGDDLDHPHGLLQSLQPNRSPIDEADSLECARKARDGLAGKDLARRRDAAQARGEIERTAAVAALDRHRFARVEPDADPERKCGLVVHALPEAGL